MPIKFATKLLTVFWILTLSIATVRILTIEDIQTTIYSLPPIQTFYSEVNKSKLGITTTTPDFDSGEIQIGELTSNLYDGNYRAEPTDTEAQLRSKIITLGASAGEIGQKIVYDQGPLGGSGKGWPMKTRDPYYDMDKYSSQGYPDSLDCSSFVGFIFNEVFAEDNPYWAYSPGTKGEGGGNTTTWLTSSGHTIQTSDEDFLPGDILLVVNSKSQHIILYLGEYKGKETVVHCTFWSQEKGVVFKQFESKEELVNHYKGKSYWLLKPTIYTTYTKGDDE